MKDRQHLYSRLTEALNTFCAENDSNTPDYILATYLLDCLDAFNRATKLREKFYGVSLEPGKTEH